jgi:hypothetical protein
MINLHLINTIFSFSVTFAFGNAKILKIWNDSDSVYGNMSNQCGGGGFFLYSMGFLLILKERGSIAKLGFIIGKSASILLDDLDCRIVSSCCAFRVIDFTLIFELEQLTNKTGHLIIW